MRFYPLISYPWCILLLLIGGAGIYLLHRHSRLVPIPLRKQLTLLHSVIIAMILLMILNPGIIIKDSQSERGAVVYLIDTSASMGTADMPRNQPRIECARHIASKLIKKTPRALRPYLYTFHHLPIAQDPAALNTPFTAGGSTDISTAIRSAEQDIGASSIEAFVILSDGLDHSERPVVTDIPMYGVYTGGSLDSLADLRIVGLRDSPRPLCRGEEWSIEIPVKASGCPSTVATSLTVTVDGEEKFRQECTLSPEKELRIPFAVSFTAAGLHRVCILLEPLPTEKITLNNHREFIVEVRDDEVTPFVYFPVLNNSFRPLLRLFTQTGRHFTALCKMRSNTCLVQGNAPLSEKLHSFPLDHKELANTDVLILGSANAADYSSNEIQCIERYVSHGGTIIVLGGPGAFISRGPDAFQDMMPALCANENFSDTTYLLTPSGAFESLSRFHPAIRGINSPDIIKPGTGVLLSCENGHIPLVLSMPYGQGQVIALLTNAMHLAGDRSSRCYQLFWELLLSRIAVRQTARLSVSIPRAIPAETPLAIGVSAEGLKSLTAVVSHPEIPAPLSHELKMGDHEYTTRFATLPKGMSTIRLNAEFTDGTRCSRFFPCYVDASPPENDDLLSRRERFLPVLPENHLFSSAETDELQNELERLSQSTSTERIYRLTMEKPWWALVILLLMMTEWILRRKNGLL